MYNIPTTLYDSRLSSFPNTKNVTSSNPFSPTSNHTMCNNPANGPKGYAKGYGPGFGPYGIQGPEGVEHGPTGMDGRSWKPNPRKVSTGWTKADYQPHVWKVVGPLIAKKAAEDAALARLAAPALSPPSDGKLSSAGGSQPKKIKLTVRAPTSLPKLTIKIKPKQSIAATPSNDDTPPKLWSCGELNCNNEDMTREPRSKTGRKFISDFFGRNKTETTVIPDDVWAYVCRKDYQRSKYASEKSLTAYSTFWLSALKTQLIRLRLWRPEATFEVKLLNRAEERLNTFNSEVLKGSNIATALKAVLVAPTMGKKGEIPPSNADIIDPMQAQHIKSTFAGIRSIDYLIDTVLPWIEQSLNSGALIRMPPIEFLIQDPLPGDIVNSPEDNYKMWREHIQPTWSKEDHKAALALMALGSHPVQPMNLTWEAHNAAVAAMNAPAAVKTRLTHTTEADDSQKGSSASSSPKGKRKHAMLDEDQEAETTGLVYNGANKEGKRRKIEPAQKKHTRNTSH